MRAMVRPGRMGYSDFLGLVAERWGRRVRRLGPGAHRLRVTIPGFIIGRLDTVLAQLVALREEAMIGLPLHHATHRALYERALGPHYSVENQAIYADGWIFLPETTTPSGVRRWKALRAIAHHLQERTGT